ncbi:hypothetical protein Bca101_098086 [Brassica carinata]
MLPWLLPFGPRKAVATRVSCPSLDKILRYFISAILNPSRFVSFLGKKEKEVLLDRPDESSEVGPVSIAIPAGGTCKASDNSASSAGDRTLNDEVDSLTHRRRRRVMEEINTVTSGSSSSRLPPPLRVSGEGTSRINSGARLSSVPEASSWVFSYDNEIPILENPDSLAAIWRKIRAEGCELPSLERMRERDAYVRMVVANAKAMEASNEYAALMERRLANFASKEEIAGHLLLIQQLRGELEVAREVERQHKAEIEESKKNLAAAEAGKVAIQSDLDSMKEKHRREIEGRDRRARKDRHHARLSLAQEYDGVLAVVKNKLEQKKKETAAEIRLQEARTRIETLIEYNEGGFELEAELERLKDLEVLLKVDYGLASVSDPSLSCLDLPGISGDSLCVRGTQVLCSQLRRHLVAPLVATRRDEPPRNLLFVVFIGKSRDNDNESLTIIVTHSHIQNQSIARSVRFFAAMDIGNKLQLIFLSIVYVCSTGGSFTHPWFPWFPWFNKGIAFTMTERDRLLPSSAMDSEHQIQRSMTDLKRMEEQARDGLSDPNALAKWRILLQDRSETIQEECIFSAEDRGGMMSMGYNYPAEQPDSGSWISRDSWNGAID